MNSVNKLFTVLYNIIRFAFTGNATKLYGVYPSFRLFKDMRSVCVFGKGFRARNNVEINVRRNAKLVVGNNVFINSGCIITVREFVEIQNNVVLGPNVMIFDHDHLISEAIIHENQFSCSPIVIGEGSWIGAGSVILRGSKIGKNCVIGAGSVIKGEYQNGSVVIQQRNERIKCIQDY